LTSTLREVVYGLANYWISAADHGRNDASQSSASTIAHTSTLPIPTAHDAEEPTKQDPAQFLQRLAAIQWEDVRPFLAFGIVAVVLLHFLSIEVYITMTQAGYFSTGCFRVCQSAALGAMGFMASRALRQNDESDVANVMEDGIMRHDTTMVLANLAFDASPAAMAITDASGRIETCNPAFVRATSLHGRLDALQQLVNDEDAERLQRCLDSCESSDGDQARDGDESDCDFLVNGTVLNIRVSLASQVAMGDAEQALAPFSLLGFLSKAAKSAARLKSSAGFHKRYVVVINDVTLNRALDRAVYESTSEMHNGQSETLMRDMMNRIASFR
jgi:PAS domain-containing protein